MDFIVNVVIFLVILFLYVHVTNHYKRSEDLEIYEMDYSNNPHLQEVCDVKQPVIFQFDVVDNELFAHVNGETMDTIENNDVKVKDIRDYYPINKTGDEWISVDYTVLPFQSSRKLMKTDIKSHYFTENNGDFVEESSRYTYFRNMDAYLKPSFVVHTTYDICMGSKMASTPMRYHTNYRQYYAVTSGKIHVKMTPFKSSKYLHPYKDYENYEFCSPVCVWQSLAGQSLAGQSLAGKNIGGTAQEKYAADLHKIKFLEFDVKAGYILHIPPYWWYSIQYSNEDETVVCGFTYDSFASTIANLPDLIKYYVQQNNIHKKTVKTLSLDEVESEPTPENEISEASTHNIETHTSEVDKLLHQ
jgi:hypothetical protein